MERIKKLITEHTRTFKSLSDRDKITASKVLSSKEWRMVADHYPLRNPHIAALRAMIEELLVPKRTISRLNRRPRKVVVL